MFYNINQYPFLQKLIGNEQLMLNELLYAQEKSEKVHQILNSQSVINIDYYTEWWVKEGGFHEDQVGEDLRKGDVGGYQPLAVFKKDYLIKHFDADLLFSKTLSLLNEIPNLYFSAFVKASENSIINSHFHNKKHLIFHLLLNDLEGGSYDITVNGETRSMSKKGDWLLFDYSYPHSAKNNSKACRYGLVIDFNPFER